MSSVLHSSETPQPRTCTACVGAPAGKHLDGGVLAKQRKHGAHIDEALLRLSVHGAQKVERHRQLCSGQPSVIAEAACCDIRRDMQLDGLQHSRLGAVYTEDRGGGGGGGAHLEQQAVHHD